MAVVVAEMVDGGARMQATPACTEKDRSKMPHIAHSTSGRLVAAIGSCLLLVGCDSTPEVASLPPPEVSVSQPIERPVAEYFETTGRSDAVETVDVRARVSGYLVNVGFRDGAVVKQGDELFLIDPRPYEAEVLRAEGQVARWEASLRKGVADVERNQRLLPKGAASEKDLESSIAARDSAEAEITTSRAELEQARLDLEFTRVTAPISGQVSRTNVTAGNLIQASPTDASVLTTIVSIDPIYVYFDVDERTLLRQRERRRANGQPGGDDVRSLDIPVEIGLASDQGYAQRGVMDFVDNRVDPGTGTIKARAVFANADRSLTPGLFVRVRVPLGDPSPAVLVTERAIGTDQGNKFVYVVNDNNVVEYRAVELGPQTDDGLRAISDGVRPGERVIVNGIQRARPGLTVAPQEVAMQPPAAGREGAAPAS
jgi:RND family efflux transporter MFP subunit